MSTLAGFLITLALIIISIGSQKKKKQKEQGPAQGQRPKNRPVNGVNRQMQKQTGSSSAVRATEENKSYLMFDDRKNDWLAKQLEEEKRAQRRITAMFDLKYDAKQSHAQNCDARAMRDFHAQNCDAEGIDTAKGK
ncbi:MAG: hypothetical protein K6G83_01425 [Lachnospiraceae bacterium]|nr:hypothetical protein [Lachnospiraceae bacterium]